MMAVASSSAEPEGGFWQRRVVNPILAQLRQGLSPQAVALTLALGFALSIFPILGATTVLCAGVALALRLNQPLIQLVNYLAYPVQLALLIPFYRAGESLLGRPHLPLSIGLLVERFKADFGQFFADFGLIALGGIAVWCLVAPVVVAVLYFALRPLLERLARREAL